MARERIRSAHDLIFTKTSTIKTGSRLNLANKALAEAQSKLEYATEKKARLEKAIVEQESASSELAFSAATLPALRCASNAQPPRHRWPRRSNFAPNSISKRSFTPQAAAACEALVPTEEKLAKIAAAKRTKLNAQKIASQAGRTLQQLKAHKYFTYRVDNAGILQLERKQDTIAAETAHDGWYLLHTNLPIARADTAQVQGHYKNLLEVEEAFCELKSYLQVRPVFHRKPERVINHVRICFLAYWISTRPARLGKKCRTNTPVARKKSLRLCLQASPIGK